MSWRTNPNPTIKPPFGSYIDWSNPITQKMVGCWIFNEYTGSYLNDLSLHDNINDALTAAWCAQGLLFNGHQYVTVPNSDSLNISDQITVRVKGLFTQKIAGDYPYVACKYIGGANGITSWSMQWHDTANALRFEAVVNGTVVDIDSIFTPSTNVWYDWIGIFDGSFVKAYINNELQNSIAASGVLDTNTYPVAFGGGLLNTGFYYLCYLYGILQFAQIWNRALSADEVAQLYSEPYCFVNWPTRKSIFDFGINIGRVSRYHNLDGLGAQGQQTWNPLG